MMEEQLLSINLTQEADDLFNTSPDPVLVDDDIVGMHPQLCDIDHCCVVLKPHFTLHELGYIDQH